MRVGLNALHLVPGETGGSELYVRRLVPALLDARPEIELVLWCGVEAAPSLANEPWASNLRLVRLPIRARWRALRVAAEQTLLAPAARRAGVDLIHNLFTTAPALAGVPQVTTILDLIYARYPEAHAPLLTRGMSLLVPLAARRSQRLIAISNATRLDLITLLGIDEGRIDVVPLAGGLTNRTQPLPEPEVRRRLGIGRQQILLTVSAKRPHKNLTRLLEALPEIPDAVLVLPGYPTPHEQELRALTADRRLNERVRFVGWIDDAFLEGLYAAAACFVFPSLAEGFGLPVLEALTRGVPVATSNATSLPEVAGDAALYFDPLDPSAIAAAVNRLLGDPELSRSLSSRGHTRSAKFSWEKTAYLTAAVYERLLSTSS